MSINRGMRNVLDQRLSTGWMEKTQNMTVCTFPNSTEGGYVLGKVLSVLGIKQRQFTPWASNDFIFNWQDLTYDKVNTLEYITESCQYSGYKLGATLNMHCSDISKRKMEQLNLEVFGYPLGINPVTFYGKACIKSDDNAAHDGSIIDCPIPSDKVDRSKVYSILINNVKDDFAIDYRVPFVGGVTGFFYEKRRNVSTRFSNTNNIVFIRNTKDYFSHSEINQISEFCKALNLDYGEMDILRDITSGKIYVVDVAKTPAGPPNGLSHSDSRLAVINLAEALAINILKIPSA